MKRIFSFLLKVITGLALLYLILLIPVKQKEEPAVIPNSTPFAWKQDSLWLQLEKNYVAAKNLSANENSMAVDSLQTALTLIYNHLQSKKLEPADSLLSEVNKLFFSLATFIAREPSAYKNYLITYNLWRNYLKQQSQSWDMDQPQAQQTLYKLLYGMRAATEEVALQFIHEQSPALLQVNTNYAGGDSVNILGASVHSGDILVSRGGAEVSALISRGNDFPGNFSHVALVYIDEKTKAPYVIESHIEKGVAISGVAEYEKDKKLRMMILRPRKDLPQLQLNARLGHEAAKNIFEHAQNLHIPYDFKMNYKDSSAMFCSEVVYYAYKNEGLPLWKHLSTISDKGVVNWLQTFGVTNFVTQMPSDLEYDPSLMVVAEYKDPETLFKDHIDNAVMDALITKANEGATLDYNLWMLPVARVIKAYCLLKNAFGKPGIIPEGMSAVQALKNESFVKIYNEARAKTLNEAQQFSDKNKYRAPYWQLVNFANEAVETIFKN